MQQPRSVRQANQEFRPTRRGVATVLAALVVLAGGGCTSTGQPSDKGPDKASGAASRSAFPVVHDDWAKMGYRLDWVGFPFVDAPPRGQGVRVLTQPDVLILQDRNSTVSVMETTTGKVRWSVDLAGPLTKFVSLDRDPSRPDQVLVCSETEAFTLSLATSNLLGRERFERVVNTRPVLAGDVAIFGTSSGEIYAHLLGRGVKAWGFVAHGGFDADPVVIGGVIGFVSQGEDVCFLTPSGTLVGRARIYGSLGNDPVTDGRLMFIAGLDQSVWAFEPSGARAWRFRTSSPLRTQPAFHKDTLYVDVPGSGLVALDPGTGAQKWVCTSVTSGTVIETRGGRLLIWTGRGLALVDPGNGDIVDQVATPGIASVHADASEDANLFVVSDRGVVAKFVPR